MKIYLTALKRGCRIEVCECNHVQDNTVLYRFDFWGKTGSVNSPTRAWRLFARFNGDYSMVDWETIKNGKSGGWRISGPLVRFNRTA